MPIGTYKAISATFASLSVRDNYSFLDGSIDSKVFPERLVCGVIRQSSNEQFRPRGVLLLDGRAVDGAGSCGGCSSGCGSAARQYPQTAHQAVWLTARPWHQHGLLMNFSALRRLADVLLVRS